MIVECLLALPKQLCVHEKHVWLFSLLSFNIYIKREKRTLLVWFSYLRLQKGRCFGFWTER